MRHTFTLLLFAALFMTGCVSSEKLIQRGQYDQAVSNSVRKLKKKPLHPKHMAWLTEAYAQANRIDNERIEYLKREGNPDNWDEIFDRYARLKRRQQLVKQLSDIPADIHFVNYDEELIHAKENAAEYSYQRGINLMQKGDRFSARAAHDEFQNVKRYYSNYQDVDGWMNAASEAGMTNVFFRMENNSPTLLPPGYEADLMKISLGDLNQGWVRYHTTIDTSLSYHYTALVNIKTIATSPEQLRESVYTEEAKVQDGYRVKKDEEGNVLMDTTGKPLKEPRFKMISCQVFETIQSKSAVLNGSLDYYDNATQQLIRSKPITAESHWAHHWAIANGNMEALSPQTRAKIGVLPAMFPPDPDMIFQTAEILKGLTKQALVENRGVLQ